MTNKVSTYIGFAIKSGKVIFGYDNLKLYDKKLYLIILCKTANDKYIQLAKNKQNITNCEICKTTDLLGNLIYKTNCKMIGIKNKELATAIINNKADILVEVK